MKPLVAIVLVNWNGVSDTLECLASLAQVTYPNFHTVVVDNASQGTDPKEIRAAYPKLTMLELEKNFGFTGGNNVGIRHAIAQGAEYILCLNNDTVVASNFLSLMVDALEADSEVGIATSAIYLYDQPDRLAALGCWIALENPYPVGHIVTVSSSELDSQDAVEVPFVEGCVLLMRRVVAEQTSGFDDQFFAYTEDADLCLRARKKGWHCVAVPRARVWHKIEGGKSSGGGSPSSIYYYNRNVLRLVKKHGTQAQRREFTRTVTMNLLRDWRYSVAHNDSLSQGFFVYQSLLPRTLGGINALLNCYGAQSRWRRLNVFLTQIIGMLISVACIIHKSLLPVYRRILRKSSS